MDTPGRGRAWRNQLLDSVLDRLGDDPDAIVDAVAPDNAARPLVRQFADVLRHRRRLTGAELERIEAMGAGVPIDRLVCDLRSAMAAAWRHLLALVPDDAEGAVAAVGHLGEEALDFAQQATEAVARGQAARSRLGALARPGLDAVDPFDSEGELARRLDTSRPYGLVVFTVGASSGDEHEALAAAACTFATCRPGTLSGGVRHDPAAHVATAVPVDAWEDVVELAQGVAADHGVVALAAGPAHGAAALYDTYADVKRLVPVAREVATGRRPDELDVYRFLAGSGRAEADAFVRRVLGPLLDLPADEVTTLLDRLDVDGTARRRVEEVTGLDLDRAFDRLRLETAAVLRRHSG